MWQIHVTFLKSNMYQFLSEKCGKAWLDLILDRCSARPSSLQIQNSESSEIAEVQTTEVKVELGQTERDECLSNMNTLPSNIGSELNIPSSNGCESSAGLNSQAKREQFEDVDMIDVDSTGIANEISCGAVESPYVPISRTVNGLGDVDMDRSLEETSGCKEEQDDTDMARSDPCPDLPNDSSFHKHSSVPRDHQNAEEDSEHVDVVKSKSITATKDNAYYGNGYVSTNMSTLPVEDSGVGSFSTDNGEGGEIKIKKVEISADI